MSSLNVMACWYRVRVRLRCESTPESPQWSAFDLRGLIKTVCKTPFTFHSVGEFLPRVRRAGHSFTLDVLLFGVDEKEAIAFRDRWRHLKHRDFMMLEAEVPQRRCLGDLVEEHPWLGWTEACLDFQVPLVCPVPGEGGPPLTAIKLMRLLEARAKHVLGASPQIPQPETLRCIPWFLERSRSEIRKSVSQPGHREIFSGLRGPLFVRGDLEGFWSLLLLASEVHLGRTVAVGAGYFLLRESRAVVDAVVSDAGIWAEEAARLREHPDHREEWNGPRAPDDGEVAAMAAAASDRRFASGAATRISIPKATGGTRIVAKLPPEVYLLHRVLGRALSKPVEVRLPAAAIAYRPGRGTALARPFMSHAVEAGCTHVAKADIASFFDEIPWDQLAGEIDEFLPQGDAITRLALESAWRLPYRDEVRTRGLLQGSPLSPLLANLFLARWDEEMSVRGYRHIRYGDDLLIAAPGEEEARLALADAEALLEPLGLRLNTEKTTVLSIAEGFHHLGLDLGGDDGDIVETAKPALRRTLYLTRSEQWVGLDHGAVLIRDGQRLVHRLPLLQISNIVMLGVGGVSTALVTACMHRAIPLVFADHSGHHCGTLHPEPRMFYLTVAGHARARAAMSPEQVEAVARQIVATKLAGYEAWAASLMPPASGVFRAAAQAGLAALARETDLPATLGVEGFAARGLFRAVNNLCRNPFWKSLRRDPRQRNDPWNLLIDTLSFLLFTRINFLVRAAGLDPYQGFLHSPAGRFESLVCDLQEPFRARLERLAVRLANLNMLQATHTLQHPDQTWTWTPEGWRIVISEFETELDRRRSDSWVTWRTAIEHLVEGVRLWAQNPQKFPPWHSPPSHSEPPKE